MEHLIADTGIHFLTREFSFNPSEPLTQPDGKLLKYAFCDTGDEVTGAPLFDLLCRLPGKDTLLLLGELRQAPGESFELFPDGRLRYDTAGVPRVRDDIAAAIFTNFDSSDTANVFSISTLDGYSVRHHGELVPALDVLLGKWLPMPLFETDDEGRTLGMPLGWCRVKMERLATDRKTGLCRFRLVWAFDTELEHDVLDDSNLRPTFFNDEPSKVFRLCNCAEQLFSFLTNDPESETAIHDYIEGLIGPASPDAAFPHKYLGFYVYFVNFLRLAGAAPEVRLFNPAVQPEVPVDLVLDIGNSRTCGVLFEDGDFRRAVMLKLQDLTHPERTYEKPFDMRLVFRKADFGDDIALSRPLFSWRSFVRIGDEARHLVYRSLEDEGMAQKQTGSSSPKRYLWDHKPAEGCWENLISVDDPTGQRLSPNVYIAQLSDYFGPDGTYYPDGYKGNDAGAHFSRSSLMTFVLIEILQQAIVQINSAGFRQKHGSIDRKRSLRRVIITCPTAMPHAEQVRLRQCAEEAYDAISKCIPLPAVEVIPSVKALEASDDTPNGTRVWSYDEASCSQLVYLYAELAQNYRGEVGRFFDLKGHVRPDLQAEGYDRKAVTIATIDIGAGTTDMMIAAYENDGQGRSRLTPIPLFYDSFYLAGDDILRNVIQNVIIEGQECTTDGVGHIAGALTHHLLRLSPDEIAAIPSVAENKVYAAQVSAIRQATSEQERDGLKRILAANLLRDFFGHDSAMMSYRDRRCRLDFNTQVSHPMSQFFMECLRRRLATCVYTFDDIFPDDRPADYLLDYFAHHFGFRFEGLRWRFDPEEMAAIVKNTMEPLLKRLSEVVHHYRCDVLVLSGRPTSLEAITELFDKHLPVWPHRIVRLGDYHVGNWYPFADGQGFFYDQKSVVAVGAMVGYIASHEGFNGMVLDFSRMVKDMKSTARYMGEYMPEQRLVKTAVLTPSIATATIDAGVFPVFIGCRQLPSPQYEARPVYAIYNHSKYPSLRIRLSRLYGHDRECITIDDVTAGGDTVPTADVELVRQSIADDGKFWLDKGEFDLYIVTPQTSTAYHER